jgi:hypothetical protein
MGQGCGSEWFLEEGNAGVYNTVMGNNIIGVAGHIEHF